MVDQENKDQLVIKFGKLNLDFSEDDNIYAPFHKISTDEKENKKRYQLLELVKYPFFLQSRSDKVVESRKGHIAYKKFKKLLKQGVSDEELDEASKYSGSTYKLKKIYKDINNQKGAWIINAHQDWGLPDSFDGHVWDIIMKLVSDTLDKYGEVYMIYPITPNMIENELIRRKVFKSRSGKTAARIKDSIYRLKNTTYSYDNGFLRKDTKEYISYDFQLITSIYERGEEKPNGTHSNKFSLAIDPIIAVNLRHNRYLIVLHNRREKLIKYESIVLFDRLSYFLYIDIKKENVFKSIQMRLDIYRKFSYEKICEYLGVEPKKGIEYKKAKIVEQMSVYHKELIDQDVLQEVIIQDTGDVGNKKYHFVYIFKREFLLDMLNLLSKADKLKDRDYTAKERKDHISFLQRQINDPQILQSLFK